MIVNAAIQIVPLCDKETAYPIIDGAIAMIQQSGLRYEVGPFETVMEGEYNKVSALLQRLTDYCNGQHNTRFLVYTKMHLCGGADILMDDKTAKFR